MKLHKKFNSQTDKRVHFGRKSILCIKDNYDHIPIESTSGNELENISHIPINKISSARVEEESNNDFNNKLRNLLRENSNLSNNCNKESKAEQGFNQTNSIKKTWKERRTIVEQEHKNRKESQKFSFLAIYRKKLLERENTTLTEWYFVVVGVDEKCYLSITLISKYYF